MEHHQEADSQDTKQPSTDRSFARARCRQVVRRLVAVVALLLPILVVVETFVIEPTWLKVKHIQLHPKPSIRLIHITDLHYKGEREYLERVVREINEQKPDVVAITGDLVEESEYAAELLEILKNIKAPMLGVPGNHETWALVEEQPLRDAFAATGGRWLRDEQIVLKDTLFFGATGKNSFTEPIGGKRRVMLCHYPAVADCVTTDWDLILAGHTHGGQIRLPFYGSLVTPYDSGGYDLGLYQTKHGPLYVNPGIGWLSIRGRFLCRPEITVIDL